jgi:hypothetical protein
LMLLWSVHTFDTKAEALSFTKHLRLRVAIYPFPLIPRQYNWSLLPVMLANCGHRNRDRQGKCPQERFGVFR